MSESRAILAVGLRALGADLYAYLQSVTFIRNGET